MTVIGVDEAQRKAARAVGLVYPLSFATVVAVNFGIFARLTAGNPPETAQNILAHETQVRVSVVDIRHQGA